MGGLGGGPMVVVGVLGGDPMDGGQWGGVAVGGPDDGMAEGIDDGLLDGTGILGGGELVGALV